LQLRTPFAAKKLATSFAVGIDGCAPFLVTEIAATAEAQEALATGSSPRKSAAANAPLNASPAAVVSTARTGYAGNMRRNPLDSAR
jgi:hypothetical protein